MILVTDTIDLHHKVTTTRQHGDAWINPILKPGIFTGVLKGGVAKKRD